MLDVLEQGLRDGSFADSRAAHPGGDGRVRDPDALGDVGDYRSPRAQKGAHDDLVIAAAIGFTVATRLPRNTKLPARPPETPMLSATGW
jgi:hypothetical protein